MACNTSPAGKYNVKIIKGNTWDTLFEFNDKADDASGTLTPITIVDAKVQVRRKASSTTAELTMVNGDGLTIAYSAVNDIKMNKVIDIAAGNYVYDIAIERVGGSIKTYLAGDFIVFDEVSELQ